jgi:uncharacterized membrane protein HdeD (DUF308 family)
MIEFAKENFQFITLIVGVLAIIIGVITLYSELKKRKNKKQ